MSLQNSEPAPISTSKGPSSNPEENTTQTPKKLRRNALIEDEFNFSLTSSPQKVSFNSSTWARRLLILTTQKQLYVFENSESETFLTSFDIINFNCVHKVSSTYIYVYCNLSREPSNVSESFSHPVIHIKSDTADDMSYFTNTLLSMISSSEDYDMSPNARISKQRRLKKELLTINTGRKLVHNTSLFRKWANDEIENSEEDNEEDDEEVEVDADGKVVNSKKMKQHLPHLVERKWSILRDSHGMMTLQQHFKEMGTTNRELDRAILFKEKILEVDSPLENNSPSPPPASIPQKESSQDEDTLISVHSKHCDNDLSIDFEKDAIVSDTESESEHTSHSDATKNSESLVKLRDFRQRRSQMTRWVPKKRYREDTSKQFELASMLISDVMKGHTSTFQHRGKDSQDDFKKIGHWRRWFSSVYTSHWFYKILILTMMIQLIILFLEPPTYFRNVNENGSKKVILTVIEFSIAIFYLIDILMSIFVFGKNLFFSKDWNPALLLFVFLTLLDSLIAVFAGSHYQYRWSRAIRPAYAICRVDRIRSTFRSIIRTFYRLRYLLMIMLLWLFVYGLIGVKLFQQIPEFTSRGLNFNNILRSLLSLYLFLTMQTFPTVVEATYSSGNRWYFLFFFSFMFVGVYLFLDLVVSLLFEAFKEERKIAIIHERIQERKALTKAFTWLDFDEPKGFMDWGTFLRLLHMLLPDTNSKEVRLLFDAVASENGQINVLSFFELCDIILLRFKKDDNFEPQKSFGYKFYKKYMDKKICFTLKGIFDSLAFERLLIFLLIANLFIDFSLEAFNESDQMKSLLSTITTIFICLFMGEFLLKLLVYGPYLFVDIWNIFELFIVLLSFFGQILAWIGNSRGYPLLSTIGSCLSFTRFFRLLVRNSEVRKLTSLIVKIIPVLISTLSILVALIYFFIVIGMEMFADKLPSGDSNIHNFDSPFQAYTTICLIITNTSWINLMEQLQSITSPWIAIYFCSVHFFCSLLFVNLIIALLLDIFLLIKSARIDSDSDEILLERRTNKFSVYKRKKRLSTELVLSKEDKEMKILSQSDADYLKRNRSNSILLKQKTDDSDVEMETLENEVEPNVFDLNVDGIEGFD